MENVGGQWVNGTHLGSLALEGVRLRGRERLPTRAFKGLEKDNIKRESGQRTGSSYRQGWAGTWLMTQSISGLNLQVQDLEKIELLEKEKICRSCRLTVPCLWGQQRAGLSFCCVSAPIRKKGLRKCSFPCLKQYTFTFSFILCNYKHLNYGIFKDYRAENL